MTLNELHELIEGAQCVYYGESEVHARVNEAGKVELFVRHMNPCPCCPPIEYTFHEFE